MAYNTIIVTDGNLRTVCNLHIEMNPFNECDSRLKTGLCICIDKTILNLGYSFTSTSEASMRIDRNKCFENICKIFVKVRTNK